MTLFGKFFKKRAGEEKETKEVSTPVTKERKGEAQEAKRTERESKIIVGVIERPHLTEKTTALGKENKYAFVVSRRSPKVGIRRAVEGRYGVRVRAVNIVNVPGKERRRGRQIGWKQGFKKAVVTLAEGNKIEIQ